MESLGYAQITATSFSTLDGRINGPVMATPGGDAGEFILALAIFSELKGAEVHLSEEKVLNIFKDYLEYMQQSTF